MTIDSEQNPTSVNNGQRVGVDLPDLASGIDHDDVAAWKTIPVQKRAELNQRRIDQYLIDWETLRTTPTPLHSDIKHNLIFFHIPKTGGTTLQHLIAKNYRPNKLLHVNEGQLEKNPTAIFMKGKLPQALMGHYSMKLIIYQAIKRPFVHVTMLREPIGRVISFYNAIYSRRQHPHHEMVISQSFDSFVENSLGELSNSQVLRLAGRLGFRLDDKPPQIGRELTDMAKENLVRRFSCFGLQERYPEFLLMAKQLLNWSDIFIDRYRNVSQRRVNRDDLDQATIDRIRERNIYDIELYEFASQLFQERCQQLGITEERVERFEQANKQYAELLSMSI